MSSNEPLIAFPPLEWGTFVERNNRFSATILWRQKELAIHVPTSGRMRELFYVGAPVAWRPFTDGAGGRKTVGQLLLAKTPSGTLVCVDSLMPNRLVWKLWQDRSLPALHAVKALRREVSFGRSRLDFASIEERVLVEVKSVTLVRDSLALFPDSPTTRGTKHVLELVEAAEAGWRSVIIFVAQHQEAEAFAPNSRRDPPFAEAIGAAARAGVQLLALKAVLNEQGIHGITALPVDMG